MGDIYPSGGSITQPSLRQIGGVRIILFSCLFVSISSVYVDVCCVI